MNTRTTDDGYRYVGAPAVSPRQQQQQWRWKRGKRRNTERHMRRELDRLQRQFELTLAQCERMDYLDRVLRSLDAERRHQMSPQLIRHRWGFQLCADSDNNNDTAA